MQVLLAQHVSAVAHADLTAALDSLHHYFDFAGRGQVGCLAAAGACRAGQEVGPVAARTSCGCMQPLY